MMPRPTPFTRFPIQFHYIILPLDAMASCNEQEWLQQHFKEENKYELDLNI